MIPIVGVSLEEALLGFGGDDDAELHDKEVELSTSDITGSQTAIFEYDPQNETPTPWDGYSLFTIDLSGVKQDIEGYLAQISALEEEIDNYEECCEDVMEVIHKYDPSYDPVPPPPEPPTPPTPPIGEEIENIIEENKGVVVPDGVDPIPIIEELGAKTGVNTSLDGKRVTFEYVGRGYYPGSDGDYTRAQASEPISEYLSINQLYSAFRLAPEPTSNYTYRTWVYSIQIEGFPKYYGYNTSSNNRTVPGDNVTGVSVNGNNVWALTETGHGTVFTAASGKSWGTDSELKIY